MHKILTIAGFDGSGGAGIQADLKTFASLGCYGLSVLTCLPIQNTQGVEKCYPMSAQMVREQLHSIFADIVPDAIKIGVLYNEEIVATVTNFLQENASGIPIVLDPVMVATSGDSLLQKRAITVLKRVMLPIATIVTPNTEEAFRLTGIPIETTTDIQKAGESLMDLGTNAVLLKGGHLCDQAATDLLLQKNTRAEWLTSQRILSPNTHGTGCTLSAGIAAGLALGNDLLPSCRQAKAYLTQAIQHGKNLEIGRGNGPVHHFYHLTPAPLQNNEDSR
ncbi:MAG: bifunctional hydroxymethylpyrimidine kinase/phosphomethylpyrimidine kinase [Pseudomonadota bacterium]